MTGFFLADDPPALPYPANHYVATSALATAIAQQVLMFFNSVTDQSNDKWSPQVVETLYWWFERWGYTYLFVSDNEIGVPGGGDWSDIATWGIGRMRKDVEGWVAEKEIIAQVRHFATCIDLDHQHIEDVLANWTSTAWTVGLWYVPMKCFLMRKHARFRSISYH